MSTRTVRAVADQVPEGPIDYLHVRPKDDLIEHTLDTTGSCICGPEVRAIEREDGSMGWLFTHHSLDGRENFE